MTGDFTGNGQTDLAITRTSPTTCRCELSNGDGTFSDPSVVDLVRRETPLVADLNGDGAPDVSVVDAAGDILYRAGRPGEPGSFAPPVTVNPGDPRRATSPSSMTDQGPTIASVDADDNAISFFALRSTGFVLVAKLATGSEPAQILSADLDGNGITDLIVRNAGDGTISVFPGDGNGWFLPARSIFRSGSAPRTSRSADLEQRRPARHRLHQQALGRGRRPREPRERSFRLPRALSRRPGAVRRHRDGRPIPGLEPRGDHERRRRDIHARRSPLARRAQPGLEHLRRAPGPGRRPPLQPDDLPDAGQPGLVVRAVDFNGDGLTGLAILTSDGLYI